MVAAQETFDLCPTDLSRLVLVTLKKRREVHDLPSRLWVALVLLEWAEDSTKEEVKPFIVTVDKCLKRLEEVWATERYDRPFIDDGWRADVIRVLKDHKSDPETGLDKIFLP